MTIQEKNMKFHSITKKGNCPENRDTIALPPKNANTTEYGFCFALADGISQCPYGKEVAQAAIKIVDYYYELSDDDFTGEGILDIALDGIWDLHKERSERHGEEYLDSASTLTVVLVYNDSFILRHYGDSNCDLFFENGKCQRTSIDFSDENGNLLSYYGGEFQTGVQKTTIPLQENTKIIISSDGISSFLDINQIKNITKDSKWKPNKFLGKLVKEAEKQGSQDDKTIIYGY